MTRDLRLFTVTSLFLGLLALPLFGDETDAKKTDTKKKKVETKSVKMRDIQMKIPKGWLVQEPSNSMRLGQISIPAVKGDKQPAELAVFFFGGTSGSVTQNLQRWVNQFQPQGRKVNVKKGKSPQGDYYLLNMSGTYNQPIGPPIRRQTKPTPNSRMVAIIVQVKDKGAYYIKVTGPDKTVAEAVDDLRASFGGDKKSEAKAEL